MLGASELAIDKQLELTMAMAVIVIATAVIGVKNGNLITIIVPCVFCFCGAAFLLTINKTIEQLLASRFCVQSFIFAIFNPIHYLVYASF